MDVQQLAIPEVILIRPRRHGDARGYFVESFSARAFRNEVAAFDFVQDNEALSGTSGTLRGLHFQRHPMAQGKLVRAIRGAIFDVAVDIRRGSSTFGEHVAAHLDAVGGAQLWVPPGFAHGYCTLETDTLVAYKVTQYYSPADDGGIRWNDPALKIDWPVGPKGAALSDKDTKLPLLTELPPTFLFEETR